MAEKIKDLLEIVILVLTICTLLKYKDKNSKSIKMGKEISPPFKSIISQLSEDIRKRYTNTILIIFVISNILGNDFKDPSNLDYIEYTLLVIALALNLLRERNKLYI